MTDELTHVRVTHAAFPATFVIPLSETITITQMHVPVDDTHTYWYSFFTSFAEPLDERHRGEIPLDTFITHTMGLEDINKAFDLMHEGKSIRTVIHF